MNALQWFEFIFSGLIQVVTLIGIAAVLDRWTVAASVKARIWNACYLSILGLIVLGLVLPHLQLFHPWSALQPESLLKVAQLESTLAMSILAVWALGFAVMLGRWMVGFTVMQRFMRSCPSISQSQHATLLGCVPAELLVVGKQKVQFRLCPDEFGPFCYQFHQPLIFLPASLLQGEAGILADVLRHELTHLQTQHPLQLFCQKLVQCLLWFHPWIWISSRRAGLIREFVCDEVSAFHSQSTAAYLRALVTIAEQSMKRLDGTLAISQSSGELLTRVRRLSQLSTQQVGSKGYGPVGIVLISALLCSQIWLPTNPLASDRSAWTPWPAWSAEVLHTMNVSVRDYQRFERRVQLHELREAAMERTLPAISIANQHTDSEE